jgi:hypothetical protein
MQATDKGAVKNRRAEDRQGRVRKIGLFFFLLEGTDAL